MPAVNKIDTKRNINMKKTLIVCSVFLLFAVTTSAQTPTYSRFHNLNTLAAEICSFDGEARILRD